MIPFPTHSTSIRPPACLLVFVTAWHMLVGLAGVRPGQTVLVLGGELRGRDRGHSDCQVISLPRDHHRWRREEAGKGAMPWVRTTESIITSRRSQRKSERSRIKKESTLWLSTWAPLLGMRVCDR